MAKKAVKKAKGPQAKTKQLLKSLDAFIEALDPVIKANGNSSVLKTLKSTATKLKAGIEDKCQDQVQSYI